VLNGLEPGLSRKPLWLGLGWCLVALIVWLSLKPPSEAMGLINDKVMHLLAYFALSAWFCQLHRPRYLVALAVLALGATLEVLQGLSGYRDMSAVDLLADAIGIGLGWAVALCYPDSLLWLERRLP
jgi:VanZ family protein